MLMKTSHKHQQYTVYQSAVGGLLQHCDIPPKDNYVFFNPLLVGYYYTRYRPILLLYVIYYCLLDTTVLLFIIGKTAVLLKRHK